MKSRAITVYQQRKTEISQGKSEPEDIKLKHHYILVADVIDAYLEARGKSHKSVRDTHFRLGWWKKHFKGCSAKSITASDIEKARYLLLGGKLPCNNGKKVQPGEGRAVATVNRYLAGLKAAYNLALMDGKLSVNPVKQVKLQSEDEYKRTRYLTTEEEDRLFHVVPEEHHPLLIVALNTGLRKTEQLSLTWDDIDFQQGLIRVNRSKTGKTRFVPMCPVVIETLKSLPRMIDNLHVFYSHVKGKRLHDLPEKWESWLKEAKIEDFHWHDLRHTFESRLVNAGCSLYVVQVYLGHSSIRVTERYSHLAKDYLKKAINLPEIPAQVPSKLPLEKSNIA